MADSLDACDRREVARDGAEAAAANFLAMADRGFHHAPGWWQYAHDAAGDLVGFLLPTVFTGSARGGLQESTLFYIGVLPGHRGQGHIVDLLIRSTELLEQVGVWRILSDTDIDNHPMIAAFRRCGYVAQEPWERPLG